MQTLAEFFFLSDSQVSNETQFEHRVKKTVVSAVFFYLKECDSEDYCNYCDLQEGDVIIFIILIAYKCTVDLEREREVLTEYIYTTMHLYWMLGHD